MYFFVLVFGYCCGTDRHLWLQGESLNCAQWSMILHFVNEDLALDIMRVTLLCKIASFLFLTKIWILIIKKHIRLTSGERHLSSVNVCLQRNIKQRKWNTDLIWYDLNNVVLKRHWHENWMLIVRWYDVWIFFLHVINICHLKLGFAQPLLKSGSSCLCIWTVVHPSEVLSLTSLGLSTSLPMSELWRPDGPKGEREY